MVVFRPGWTFEDGILIAKVHTSDKSPNEAEIKYDSKEDTLYTNGDLHWTDALDAKVASIQLVKDFKRGKFKLGQEVCIAWG